MNAGADDLRAFWLRAVGLAVLIIVVGSAAFLVFLPNGPAAAFGLVLGGATSILRFNMRYRAMRRGTSARALVAQRLGTFLLNGAVLAAAFAKPEVAWPWSTVGGLFVMNVSVIAAEFLSHRSAARQPDLADQ